MRTLGDRCLLKSGIYPVGSAPIRVDGKAGTPLAHVAVAGAGDGAVVLDGTVDVASLAAEPQPQQQAWEAAACWVRLFVVIFKINTTFRG